MDRENRATRVWAAYGFVLVLALAAASWLPVPWRLIPAALVLLLVLVVTPRITRRFRDR